jgi:hypothetical protein
MDSMLTGVLVVAGVAALALVMRMGSRSDESAGQGTLSGPAPEPEEMPEALLEPDGADEEPGGEIAAMSSDGWTFVPFGNGVRLWSPAGEDAEPGESPKGGPGPSRPAVVLSAGDLIAARVVRGTPGEAPWVLETLGRDREFSSWTFETEEAAHAARELLERLVVKVPASRYGEPEPVTDAEMEEARHIAEETMRELANMPETEPPEEPKG